MLDVVSDYFHFYLLLDISVLKLFVLFKRLSNFCNWMMMSCWMSMVLCLKYRFGRLFTFTNIWILDNIATQNVQLLFNTELGYIFPFDHYIYETCSSDLAMNSNVFLHCLLLTNTRYLCTWSSVCTGHWNKKHPGHKYPSCLWININLWFIVRFGILIWKNYNGLCSNYNSQVLSCCVCLALIQFCKSMQVDILSRPDI